MEKEFRPSQIKKSEIIHSDSAHYQILDFNGEGFFGKVARCLNLVTDKEVAVKILKLRGECETKFIKWEVKMLKTVMTLDPDKINIVRFFETFKFQNLSCLVFEMLDMSLWDLMFQRGWTPMSLNEIRPVMHQLFVAFDALKRLGIMYTDLKPDNVMLVNHRDHPFKIKLIDFGLAIPESKAQTGMAMQPCQYRAPEVILGLPLSTAIDMWSIGCLMTTLFFGNNIFSTSCSYNWMRIMVHLLGQPDNQQLNLGRYTKKYFIWEDDPKNPGWRFKTPDEYKEVTGVTPQVSKKFFCFKDLEDAVYTKKVNGDPMEFQDQMAFFNLLKRILHMNSEERITPEEAIKHSFVTMTHLVEVSIYAGAAFQLMTVSPQSRDKLYDSLHTESDTQKDRGSAGSSNCDDLDTVSTTDSLEAPHAFEVVELDMWSSSDEDCSDVDSSIRANSDQSIERINSYGDHVDQVSIGPDIDAVSAGTDEDKVSFGHNLDIVSFGLDEDIISIGPGEDELSLGPDIVEFSIGHNGEVVNPGCNGHKVRNHPDGEEIKTSPDRPRRKTFCRRVRKFFSRVRKTMLSIFICGKTESAD